MTKLRYDVVIIGAGPSGSMTARYAAAGDAKVLMIDKKKQIGMPVQCGEFIPSIEEIRGTFPKIGMKKLKEVFDIDKSLISRNLTKVIMVSPQGNEYELSYHCFSIDREKFDNHLVNLAIKSGAELMIDTKFLRLRGSEIITNKNRISTKVIVGADGPFSNVARYIGLSTPKRLVPGIRCEVKGDFGHSVRMYFGNSYAPGGGYAWIIPKKRCANIGVGAQSYKIPINKLLYSFLKKIGETTTKMTVGYIPMSGPIPRTVRNNVIVVGDAAGHVMATNGGGIPTAMICGYIAGKVISRYIEEGNDLRKYEKEWRDAIGRELNTAIWTKRLADIAFKSDILLELAMKQLGSQGLDRVIRCKPLFL